MSENVRTRKRARDIAIKIADQIEDEKQGVDPEDLAPLVPVESAASTQPRKPWARRAALTSRRRVEVLEDVVGPAEAQDCMEQTAMLILEHANFDSEWVHVGWDCNLIVGVRFECGCSSGFWGYWWTVYTKLGQRVESVE